MNRVSGYLAAAVGVGLLAGAGMSEEPMKASHKEVPAAGEVLREQAGHIMLRPDDLKWQDGPLGLPAGSKFAVLEGDPSQSGPFTIRTDFPAGYKIMPHTHPGIEHVTVISGSLYMGLGGRFDEAAAHELLPGSFAVMAVGTQHFAFTRERTVIQLHGVGPWGIVYVNPADDPRR